MVKSFYFILFPFTIINFHLIFMCVFIFVFGLHYLFLFDKFTPILSVFFQNFCFIMQMSEAVME